MLLLLSYINRDRYQCWSWWKAFWELYDAYLKKVRLGSSSINKFTSKSQGLHNVHLCCDSEYLRLPVSPYIMLDLQKISSPLTWLEFWERRFHVWPYVVVSGKKDVTRKIYRWNLRFAFALIHTLLFPLWVPNTRWEFFSWCKRRENHRYFMEYSGVICVLLWSGSRGGLWFDNVWYVAFVAKGS